MHFLIGKIPLGPLLEKGDDVITLLFLKYD